MLRQRSNPIFNTNSLSAVLKISDNYTEYISSGIRMTFKAPIYKELPIREDAPPGSSWGLFDKDGKRDALGTLNFITPEAVVAAKEEIQTGESVVLK
jgi:hypothetical protein